MLRWVNRGMAESEYMRKLASCMYVDIRVFFFCSFAENGVGVHAAVLQDAVYGLRRQCGLQVNRNREG